MREREHKILGWSVLVTLLVFITFALFYSYFTKGSAYYFASLGIPEFVAFFTSLGWYAYPLFIFFTILEIVFAPVNAAPLFISSGIIFGGFIGGTLIMIGTLIGSTIAFYIGKTIGTPILQHYKGKSVDRFNTFSEKYGVLALFLIRVNPITNFDALSYVAGASRLKYVPFIVATMLSQAPTVYISSYFISELSESSPLVAILLIWIGLVFMLVLSYISLVHLQLVRRQAKLKRVKKSVQ